ncbi:MAG: response regulator [Pseudomonadota bacterium]
MDKIRMLVVDDEIVVQRSCVDIFTEKSENYEIVTVSSGEEALAALKKQRFDIILTDIKMPGLPGLQLLMVIREKYPDIAVVVITGYATVKTAVEAMKLGAVDFIPKPFTPDEIYNSVENLAACIKRKKP